MAGNPCALKLGDSMPKNIKGNESLPQILIS